MKHLRLALVFGSLLLSASSFAQIQTTIAALRTLASPSTTQPYLITDVGKEGLFYYDPKDLNVADNGGTVIVNGTKRYKRLYSGAVDIRWFGAKGDYNGTTGTDNTAAINAAIAGAKKGETLMFPSGQYRIFSNISMPLTTVKRLKFEIYGDIYFSRGAGFIIEGANQDFRSYGLIAGMNSGAKTEAAYQAYAGTGILMKNTNQCYVEVNEIKDFKYGIHMTGSASGTSNGCQYNKVHFNTIHHNYVQIRISVAGTASPGNWNNQSSWYGGQLGRGLTWTTYGAGGWIGLQCVYEAGNAKDPINGHMFHDFGFEGLEKCVVMSNASYNNFFGGRIEPSGSHFGFDMDPVTCVNNKILGMHQIEERFFTTGRIGANTVINGTPLWTGELGTNNMVFGGAEATSSPTPNKLLITTNKYTYTNFMVNKVHDLISQTGQYPTIQAMMYRIKGVVRSVGYKKTFLHVKAATAGSPLALPPNIGLVRVEATQAKVFKIDTGDLAQYGEEFMVEYLSPKYPISFVRSDNSNVLIAATQFPSGGTYRCVWADGQYKVSKIGAEHKALTQTGGSYVIADGIETHYVDYPYGNATSTLPPAASWPGRTIIIKNLQAGKTVTVSGVSASDESIIPGRGAMTVKSDGTTWNIISFYKRNLTY